MTRIFTESDKLIDFAAFINDHPVLCDEARDWMNSYGDISLDEAFRRVLEDTSIPVDWCTFVIGYYRQNVNQTIRQYCINKIKQHKETTINLISSPMLDTEIKIELLGG